MGDSKLSTVQAGAGRGEVGVINGAISWCHS